MKETMIYFDYLTNDEEKKTSLKYILYYIVEEFLKKVTAFFQPLVPNPFTKSVQQHEP